MYLETLVIGSNGWIGKYLLQSFPSFNPANISSNLSYRDFKEWLSGQNHQCFVNCVGKFSGPTHEMEWANVGVTELILTHAKKIGARVICLGSAAEYGKNGSSILREDADTKPITEYGEQKLVATNMINDFAQTGTSAISARLFNVIGPNQPYSTAIGQIIKKMESLSTKNELYLNNFDITRDYITIDFVARTIKRLIEIDLIGVLNVGSGKPIKLIDFVSRIGKLKNVYIKQGSLSEDRILCSVADTSKLESLNIEDCNVGLDALSKLCLQKSDY
jgi:nucleoside-diphosphate-sugar epimerase